MATNVDLMKFLKDNPPKKQFVPYCHVDGEADALTVYFEGDADYSERLSDHVTLFRSIETQELVGCRVKGIDELLKDLPNYIRINHGDVELSVIFWAFRGSAPDSSVSKTINELARTAAEKNLVLQSMA